MFGGRFGKDNGFPHIVSGDEPRLAWIGAGP